MMKRSLFQTIALRGVFMLNLYGLFMATPMCIAKSIRDISRLTTGQVHAIYAPRSISELQSIVRKAKYPIAIAGGRFSQGGHIWYNNGITIDMKNLNAISLDAGNKTITVQAGATWRQIQECIDAHGLSIKVMQSYNDFTVGGSLSVNAHGRTLDYGALIETIDSIKLLIADGSIITADRSLNYDLFQAAIGGYGAVGIITEATFSLTENEQIECKSAIMPLSEYPEYFKKIIHENPSVVFHNADLSVTNYNTITSITWYKTDKNLTYEERLQRHNFLSFEHQGFQLARYITAIQHLRLPARAIKLKSNKDTVVLRNYEMSTPAKSVEPLARTLTTTVLQEYFVPCHKLESFVSQLKEIATKYKINIMNVSIRYVHRDTESIMAYAQNDESFALVCYLNMRNSNAGMKYAEQWTQELINAVLECGGTYYLPYQLHATREQFLKAYPRTPELLKIKNQVDPRHVFMNSFLKKYVA